MSDVSVGLGTKVGYGLTLLGVIVTGVISAGADLHLPAQTMAILTASAGILTTLGRMGQAASKKG